MTLLSDSCEAHLLSARTQTQHVCCTTAFRENQYGMQSCWRWHDAARYQWCAGFSAWAVCCGYVCAYLACLQVEAQIEAVAKSVEDASKALPGLTSEQQQLQVRYPFPAGTALFQAISSDCTRT